MRIPIPVTSWQHRLFSAGRIVAVLACLLFMAPLADAGPLPQAETSSSGAVSQPMGQFLNADGTLMLPTRLAANLDPRGYRLVNGLGEAPRFALVGPDAGPGDENWVGGISPAVLGVDGYVEAMAIDAHGHMYVGGNFVVVGNTVANHIAKWNGVTWSALGSGVGGYNYSYVSALAFDAAGNLYAGGGFTTAGGVSANHIARWDGATWSALGSGMDGCGDYPCISALAFDAAGNLYAGGNFTTAGGVNANYIAKWNGSTWSSVGSGMGGYDPWVETLAFDAAGNLYVGGSFTTAGGVSAHNIARWNGTNWSPLGSGMSGYNYPHVSALAFDATGNLYAGGCFVMAGGVGANYIAKWNGASWSSLGSGMNSCVTALAFDAAGNLYVGGWFTTASGMSANHVASWDGVTWSALGNGVEGTVYAVAIDVLGNLYVGGDFIMASGVSVGKIAMWNGGSWFSLGEGMNSWVNALAVDMSGNLYAGGRFTSVDGVDANHIAKWNGATWSPLGSGTNGLVRALVVDAAGNLYAGGDFTTAGGVIANHIAKWNGATWSPLGTGIGGVEDPWVWALACDSIGNLYAGGSFATAGGVIANHIAKWNGTSWSSLGGGMGGGAYDYKHVYALVVDMGDNLYAGGSFATAGGVSANYIAKWNGVTWSPLSSGMGGGERPWVWTLAFDAVGNLYAGGSFTMAGGVSASRIAKWDGASWFPLGSGMDRGVLALAFDTAGNLYAGGNFTTAGGISVHNIAKWNDATWSPLGSGMGGGVGVLALDAAANLYAGGGFTTAGNQVSAYIARWTAADGVRGVTTGNYTFYANNLPVTIRVITSGSLYRLALQRFNRSHSQATSNFNTGYYWEIVGRDANDNPASGYVVDLTLPTTFTPGAGDQVCRFTNNGWDCAISSHTANSIMRTGITQLSDWTVVNNSSSTYFPLALRER